MTPMMQQYFEIKKQYPDTLLFYRLGDFYEMFFDDAILASRELELTLTGRDCGEEERAPMCGVPFHSADSYIGRLVEKGYRVAICEQTEDPALAKGLVRREVIRVVSPGTVIDAAQLSDQKNNYIAAVSCVDERVGVCFGDISTGQLFATQFDGAKRFDRLASELCIYTPREVLLPCNPGELFEAGKYIENKLHPFTVVRHPSKAEELDYIEATNACYGDKFTPSEKNLPITLAIGSLLKYLEETQKIDLSYLSELKIYSDGQYLEIDSATRRNLELCETMRTKEKRGSLLWVLDRTHTSMGARMLRKWVELPLISLPDIERRLDAVNELFDNFMLREEIGIGLKGALDLERLLTKLVYGTASGKDLVAIKQTIAVIPEIKGLLSGVTSEELSVLNKNLDSLTDLHALIEENIKDEPPFSIREGGIIKDGANEQIDYLRHIVSDSTDIIKQLEEREREMTGIKNLKVGYNRVFGYYIEVTRSQLSLVPETYIRKQTLAGAERYITQELKDTESTLLGAADRLNALEYDLFKKICEKLIENSARLKLAAEMLAKLDAYTSLADVAVKNGYVRPIIDTTDRIEIVDGRHPVVEKFVSDSYFVPNDTLLDTGDNKLMLITGPNMAGKSTYMRQVALITLMAQIGSYVPARSAYIGICDKIFTRVGASDDLASGQSTFMLEMNEVANILKNATKNSLIIYDEIGRGTSTYDGMSIARAIIEYTAGPKLSAKTLFATHYHELTSLEDSIRGVVNYNIAAKKRGDDITFLRKIVRGAADDSYGIEVAKLAGVPNEVIKRAKEVLSEIEQGVPHAVKTTPKSDEPQNEITFETMIAMNVAESIKEMSLETLTPIEAMNELFKLKKLLGQ